MSLILDALRKSEAERRRGQSPGLFSTSNIAAPASRSGPRWWPVAVFVVLMLASGWVIWDGRTKRALDDAAPVDEVAAAEPAATDEGDTNSETAAPEGERADGVATPALATGPAVPSGETPATPVAAAAPTSQATSGIGAATPPAPATAAVAPAFTNPRAAIPQVLPTPPVEPPAAEPPAEEALPTLAVLDSVTRGTLPALKLSMHVWGQEPGKRFAIVDGQRVAEGSMLGNGVVEQIRRDGVVINVNGQRLLLPKP